MVAQFTPFELCNPRLPRVEVASVWFDRTAMGGAETVQRYSTDTAVGTAMDISERAAKARSANANHLRDLVWTLHNGRELSQFDFWRFFVDVQSFQQPDAIVFDSPDHLWTISENLSRNLVAHAEAEAFVSAKGRVKILDSLFEFYLGGDGVEPENEVSIDEVRQFLLARVTKYVVFRIRLRKPSNSFEAPSTQSWVHSFMLWTGISPPMVVTQLHVTFTTNRSLGEKNVYSRSRFVRHCRRQLDRRPFHHDGQSRLSYYSSSARLPYHGRRERLCLASAGRQGTLDRASSR